MSEHDPEVLRWAEIAFMAIRRVRHPDAELCSVLSIDEHAQARKYAFAAARAVVSEMEASRDSGLLYSGIGAHSSCQPRVSAKRL